MLTFVNVLSVGMTAHSERMRDYLALEAEALLLEARRSRLFDHAGNRGTEAENSIRRWLCRRFAPSYTVSSGELIDSFDTLADQKSRQQDGVLHQNDAEANRFLLPSGMRLIPIETVAASIEVKLTLDRPRFSSADAVATEVAQLRWRVPHQAQFPRNPVSARASRIHAEQTVRVDDVDVERGVSLSHGLFGSNRPVFALFAFGGVTEPELIAEWLLEAKTIQLVCCLEAGTVWRLPYRAADEQRMCSVTQRDSALSMFAHLLDCAIDAHGGLRRVVQPHFGMYSGLESLTYWEHTGYEPPGWYHASPDELQRRARLYQARPEAKRFRKT